MNNNDYPNDFLNDFPNDYPNDFPFATFLVFFPLIIASLSAVAYQQAQVKPTTISCNSGRLYPNASSCQKQIGYILLPNSTASNPQRTDTTFPLEK
jgi:hypothetical protein